MATLTQTPRIELHMTLDLNEVEAKALSELSKYNHDQIVDAIYKHLGKGYIQPYESGLRSFLAAVNKHSDYVRRFDEARAAFNEAPASVKAVVPIPPPAPSS